MRSLLVVVVVAVHSGAKELKFWKAYMQASFWAVSGRKMRFDLRVMSVRSS
jgi:hypothetical protein